MQSPESFDRAVFQSALKKCSQRDYKNGIPELAASFGMSKSTVSRSWVRTTGKKLDEFMSRDFSATPIVAVLLDGKRFQSVGCLIALGIDLQGKKHILGVYECSTENAESCKSLLEDLERRGLPERDLLFVIDGGSGLNKALRDKYEVHQKEERRAVVVRCYVHKWENLKASLSPEQQLEAKSLYWAVRDARDLSQASACSEQLKAFLRRVNGSALRSYLEAEDELLNLHRLKLAGSLKKFFSSTNPIESLNSLLEDDMRRVKRWRDSTQFRRWIATMALKNEARMRRVRGCLGMKALQVQIQNLCHPEKIDADEAVA
jgi:transposase-like protein